MEQLGTSLIESIMVLVQFVPILFGLSLGIPIFFFGDWPYGLITGAIVWSIGGTLFFDIPRLGVEASRNRIRSPEKRGCISKKS